MNRFLQHAVVEHGLRLASIEGGSLRNAIPRESFAVVTVPPSKADDLVKCVADYEKLYRSELSATEPDLKFTIAATSAPQSVIDAASLDKVMKAINACPNGVMRMSDDMIGLVETSTNLASVKSDNGKIYVQCLLRSSVDSAQQDLGGMIKDVFELAGADVVLDGTYPGWKPNMKSAILITMQEVYQKLYGRIPEIKAIHAGLECGLLGGVYPNWDMISFGPTIRYPHSPDEKVHIASVEKFWNWLTNTLKDAPLKEGSVS
jgi:dipeptidase D